MTTAATHTVQEGFTLKEKLVYSAVGIIVTGGLVYFGRKIVLGMRANSEERKSMDENSTAAFAKRIKMAFDNDGWWGTNKTELRTVMRQIPSKQVFQQVLTSYQKLFNQNLLKDMSNELTSTEYNEMQQILTAKPDKITKGAKTTLNYLSWAKRLKAAFDKTYGFIPGTDEEAIEAVCIEVPTQAAFVMVGKAYNQEYRRNLITDLKSELSTTDYTRYMKIIISKPKQ